MERWFFEVNIVGTDFVSERIRFIVIGSIPFGYFSAYLELKYFVSCFIISRAISDLMSAVNLHFIYTFIHNNKLSLWNNKLSVLRILALSGVSFYKPAVTSGSCNFQFKANITLTRKWTVYWIMFRGVKILKISLRIQ